jgi:hypothetical protein
VQQPASVGGELDARAHLVYLGGLLVDDAGDAGAGEERGRRQAGDPAADNRDP